MLGQKSIYRLDYLGERILGTDIKSLLRYAKQRNYTITFNELTLQRILKFGYNNNWDTCFNNITRVTDNNYIPIVKIPTDSLEKAIEVSVSSKVSPIDKDKVAVLFSGGIDSTILLYYILRLFSSNVDVYSISKTDDTPYIVNIIEEWKLEDNHYWVNLGVIDDIEITDDMLLANESPIDMGSLAINFKLFERIRICNNKIKYLITGDGADEMFAKYGRNKYYDSRLTDVWDELIFYHIPRLEKTAAYFNLELITPYIDQDILGKAMIAKHSDAKFGKVIKELYKDKIPIEIIERNKVALRRKIFGDKEDTMFERVKLNKQFKEVFRYEYGIAG